MYISLIMDVSIMLDLNGGFYSYKLSTKNSRIVVVPIKSSFDFYIFNKIKYVCTSFTCVVNGLCFLARILLFASLSLLFFSCSSLSSSISPLLALIANLFSTSTMYLSSISSLFYNIKSLQYNEICYNIGYVSQRYFGSF